MVLHVYSPRCGSASRLALAGILGDVDRRMSMANLIGRLLPNFIARKLRERALHGATVFCPVCERGAIAFLPSGSPPRPHVLCPFCGSRERARMTWLYLKEQNLLRPGLRILHVAPEACLRDRLKELPQATYVAGDKHETGYTYPPGTIDGRDRTKIPG